MVVAPDSEGRVKQDREIRAAEIWETRSHAHHNRDFRFNSQPLAVAFTETPTIGGRAWPNVKFDDRAHEIAHTLWGNATLGLYQFVLTMPQIAWPAPPDRHSGEGRNPESPISENTAALHEIGITLLLVALQSSAGGTRQYANHSHAVDADAGRDQAVPGAAREG